MAKVEKNVGRIRVASVLLFHKLDVWAADSVFFFCFICLAKINVNKACFVMKLGTTTTKNGEKQHKYCRIWASSTPH